MLPTLDLFAKQKKKVSICNSQYQVISPLKEAEGISYIVNAGKVNELSFKVPLFMDTLSEGRTENKHIDMLQDRTIIKFKYNVTTEFFLIDTHEDSDDEYRNIHCFSLGYQLNDRLLMNYKSMDYVTYTDSNTGQIVTEYMESPISLRMALEDAIQKHRTWEIDVVDSAFDGLKRQFEFDSKTPLEYVYEIAEKFNAIIEWDTENRIISAYHPDNYGSDRGFKITDENYIASLVKRSSPDEFCTRLFLYGKDNITINTISPSGQSYIEDYSYFINSGLMSTGLASSLETYQAYVESRKSEFPDLLAQLTTLQSEMSTMQIELSGLLNQQKIVRDTLDLARTETGGVFEIKPYRLFTDSLKPYTYVDRTSNETNKRVYFFKLIYQRFPYPNEVPTVSMAYSGSGSFNVPYVKLGWHIVKTIGTVALTLDNWTGVIYETGFLVKISDDEYNNLTTTQLQEKYNVYYWNDLVAVKQADINNKQAEIDAIQSQINALSNDLDIANHLTVAQLDELDQFIIEKEYYDENLTTPEALLEEGKKQFEEKSSPITSFDVSLINFFELLEEKRNWNRLSIYDLVRIKSDRLKVDIKARVTTIQIDDESIALTIANTKNTKTEAEKTIQLLYGSANTTTTLTKSKSTWNQIETVQNNLTDYLSNPIDTDKQPIHAGSNTLDINGLKSVSPEDENKYLVMNNAVLASVADGGNWNVVVDSNGVKGDFLVGTLTISDLLALKNESNTFNVTKDAVTMTNALLTTPTISSEAFKNLILQTGSTSLTENTCMYYKDAGGIVRFRGLLVPPSNTGGTLVATLPANYRPAVDMNPSVYYKGTDGVTRVAHITIAASDGTMKLWNFTNAISYIYLDTLNPFRAEQ